MILGLQFLAVIFALLMVYLAYVSFRRKEINRVEAGIWTLAWSIALLMVLFPNTLRNFAETFFISRLLDVLIMGGFVLIITMVAIAYIKTRQVEKKIEELVRKLALKDMKLNKKK